MLAKIKTYLSDLKAAKTKADSVIVTTVGIVTAHPVLVGALCVASALIGHVL